MELTPIMQHLMDTGFHVAEQQLKEGKEISPQITLYGEVEKGGIFVPIVGLDDLRSKAQRIVQQVWASIVAERPKAKLLAISVLVDTWVEDFSAVAAASKREGKFVPPSEIATSQEIILVQLSKKDEDVVFQWPYVRVGKEVLFSGKPEKNEHIKAIIPGLWPLYRRF